MMSESGMLFLYFRASLTIDNYTRYPDSVLMGLTKVGGLLALFRILIGLRIFHRWQFEKKVEKIITA